MECVPLHSMSFKLQGFRPLLNGLQWIAPMNSIDWITPMEPIATYTEVRFDGARTFTLLSDRVVVRGKQTLQSDFESRIPLASLDPNFDRISLRNPAFTIGFGMVIVSLVTCSILITGLKMSYLDLAPGLVLMMGVTGLLFSAATYRKVEFLRFKNREGITLMDVARSGAQAAQFDSFVEALTKQIGETRA